MESAIGNAGSPVNALVQWLGEIEVETAALDRRISELQNQGESLSGCAVDLDHVASTLADFDGLWDVLIPARRSRLVDLLIERVVCSADVKSRPV